MPPQVTTTQLQKHTQIGLSILLGLVILGLVGGYIYVGMYLAKQGDAPVVVEEESKQVPTKDEERAAIIRALEANNANQPPVDPEVRAQIVENLEKQKPVTSASSEGERQQIIDALQRQ